MTDFDRAPFPWFGGKSRAADLIWSRLGTDCGNYVEPFFGSGAVWLNRPAAYAGWCTVNDLDGNVANFCRAVTLHPDETAEAACCPVNEADLHARHLRLVTECGRLTDRLMADPDYCEPVLAGWWAWGACVWIGSGWCDGTGPWIAEPDDEGVPVLVRGTAGAGVNRKLPHLGTAGAGVNRKLPHLGTAGRGVNRQLKSDRLEWITEWFRHLQSRLRDARVCCGDWTRVMSVGTMTLNGVCAVLLDPPYSQTEPVYAKDGREISAAVREWCQKHGGNKRLRIALCGHEGEHNALESDGWTVETWAKLGGYQGADDRERIWFSPHCLSDRQARLF
jgi:DNA adenine methylase